MTTKGLAVVWFAVLGLAAAVVLLLGVVGRDRLALLHSQAIPKVPVVFIGSSLMGYAVPTEGGRAEDLLGDGRQFARVYMNGITEDQTLSLLGDALDRGAQTVFVEADTFAFDFADRYVEPVRPWPTKLMQELLDFDEALASGAKTLLGLKVQIHILTEDPPSLDGKFNGKSLDPLRYPLSLHFPHKWDRLESLLRRAKAQGAKVVLIAPPRSQWAAQLIGVEGSMALNRHFDALAARLGVPIFNPATAWPDEYFIDQAHMNRLGRQRFLKELKAWWDHRS